MGDFRINKGRLEKRIKDLSQFGMNEVGGIDRSIGSEADKKTRKWLINLFQEKLRAKVKIDSIANIWAKVDGKNN